MRVGCTQCLWWPFALVGVGREVDKPLPIGLMPWWLQHSSSQKRNQRFLPVSPALLETDYISSPQQGPGDKDLPGNSLPDSLPAVLPSALHKILVYAFVESNALPLRTSLALLPWRGEILRHKGQLKLF